MPAIARRRRRSRGPRRPSPARRASDLILRDRAGLAELRTRPITLRHARRAHFAGVPGGQGEDRCAAFPMEWGWPFALLLFPMDLNLDKPVPGNGIIRPAPLPLDLHAELWR